MFVQDQKSRMSLCLLVLASMMMLCACGEVKREADFIDWDHLPYPQGGGE